MMKEAAAQLAVLVFAYHQFAVCSSEKGDEADEH